MVRFWLFCFFHFFLCAGILAQPFTALDSLRGGFHANRSCYDLTHYHLKLKINPQTRFISSTNRISGTAITATKTIQIDLAANFDIQFMLSNFGELSWKRIGSSITVFFPAALTIGDRFWIDVAYAGHPQTASHAPWDGGFVWATDAENRPWIGVACEGEGSSIWFPGKDHPADEPDSATLEYEVPRHLVAVGNGRFVKKQAVSDSTIRYTYKVSYPINHYNISFCAGAYDSWADTTRLPDGQRLDMQFYALPEDMAKARRQFAQSKKVISVMSQLFGNYPFIRDGYKLVQVPFLGMEHQSCIAYGDKFDDNAFGFDFIVMHETGHEWWGNRTSAADKADMWIHESFCTYAEALYVERISGKKAAQHYLLGQKKKIKNKSPVQGPDGVYFDGWADSDMYYKGTWMLHSLRTVIGNDSLWFSWLKSFDTHFGLAPIRTRDVVDYASSYFRLNLEPFFRQYLIATDWPQLEIKFENKDAKHWVAYRWAGVVAGFEYPVELVINGKTLKISPKQNWSKLETEFAQPTVQLDEGSFLAKIKALKNQ